MDVVSNFIVLHSGYALLKSAVKGNQSCNLCLSFILFLAQILFFLKYSDIIFCPPWSCWRTAGCRSSPRPVAAPPRSSARPATCCCTSRCPPGSPPGAGDMVYNQMIMDRKSNIPTSMWKVCSKPPSKPESQTTRIPTRVWLATWQWCGVSGTAEMCLFQGFSAQVK